MNGSAIVGIKLALLRSMDVFAPLLILCVVVAIYGQVGKHGFVAWDDTSYISENPRVLQGLHWENVVWAFTTFQLSNWHPLTLLSHMFDVTIWGVRPGPQALENVLLHACNSLMVYAFVRRIDADPAGNLAYNRLGACFVAVAFAAHPLHVESVAWISERKDVLCAFFWMGAVHAYIGYIHRPSIRTYAFTTALIALSLVAKPMAVTLPVVLMILDHWVLHRASGENCSHRSLFLVEKLPWFALAGATGALTIMAQKNAIPSFGMLDRVQVGISAYGWYLQKTLWPSDLHFYYLAESAWYPVRAFVSLGALLTLSIIAYRWRVRHPAILAGWLWFLVALLPVVGFIKVGTQAWADRYAYLPHVGLFWMAYGLASATLAAFRAKVALFVIAIPSLVMAGWLASVQVSVWRNTATLYGHALRIEPSHYVAVMGLANEAYRQQDYLLARQMADQALQLSAGSGLVRSMRALLGDISAQQGDFPGAIAQYQLGKNADPIDDVIRTKLGVVYLKAGRLADAEVSFVEALSRNDASLEAINGLGVVLATLGKRAEAASVLRRGMLLAPGNRNLRHNLATLAVQSGDRSGAIAAYRELLAMNPDDRAAQSALNALLEKSQSLSD